MGIYFDQNNKMVFDCRDGTKVINSNCYSIYDDWFMPSKDELYEMYLILKVYGVGGFSNAWYFTSSEADATRAYARTFTSAFEALYNKTSSLYVRACRSFTSTTVYALRDTGPAGGYIFYKNLNNYLEAAPSDQSTGQTWSNITNVEIGVTAQGTTIGVGQSNTTAIIGQVGHTNSAAKLCDDLTITK